jgi:hypothetical protein
MSDPPASLSGCICSGFAANGLVSLDHAVFVGIAHPSYRGAIKAAENIDVFLWSPHESAAEITGA